MQYKIQTAVRILLGALFLFAGGAFFFMSPTPPPGDLGTFFVGLSASKYFLYLLKGTEVLCALFLLSGSYVPLALVILAPIAINIFLVHAFLAPEGLAVAAAVLAAVVYLAFFSPSYSVTIKKLFVRK